MPWSIAERDGRYCVIKDSDGSTAGCHDSREQALAQQRALYANEPKMASLELDTDALMEEFFPDPEPVQPFRIELGAAPSEANDALIAALSALAQRQEAAEERQAELVQIVRDLAGMVNSDREYLVASLSALTAAILEQPAPVVNVEIPENPAPVVNLPEPVVNVTVEAPAVSSKRVKIERDPITNLIASAEVEEVERGG